MGPARSSVWCIMSCWIRLNPSQEIGIGRKDAFEPSIKEETESYPPAWQCSFTCRKTGQDILGNAEMGGLTLSAVRSRRCSFRLPFILTDGTWACSSAFPLSWRSQKMDRFVGHLKRHIFFPYGIRQLPER